MQFSKKDLDIILKYVVERAFKHRLSDYPELEEITGEEVTPIVHDNTNKVLKLNDLIHVPAIKGEFDRVDNRISDLDESVGNKLEDMQNQIDGFDEHGVFVSNEFGTNTHIGVSQKTLTDAINKIWQKIEDITGEIIQGINMVVTPTFFVSEDGCNIHVSANTVETNGIFEKIQFFIDGELIHEDTNTEYVSFDHHLDVKNEYEYVVMCKAKIMGIEYTRQQIVTRYNEFYIGTGSTYADIMDSAHAKQLNGTMRHNYDITFTDGQKLIIVMGASLYDGFIRADLNGAEIELTEETVTIDDKQYVVLTSEAWSEGDYNIDING